MTRPFTPGVKTGNTTTFTVQRCCNGCGRSIGDVTEAEMDTVMNGQPLPDVRDECGCPRTENGL